MCRATQCPHCALGRCPRLIYSDGRGEGPGCIHGAEPRPARGGQARLGRGAMRPKPASRHRTAVGAALFHQSASPRAGSADPCPSCLPATSPSRIPWAGNEHLRTKGCRGTRPRACEDSSMGAAALPETRGHHWADRAPHCAHTIRGTVYHAHVAHGPASRTGVSLNAARRGRWS